MRWIEIRVSEQQIRLQHSGLTRLEATRLALGAAINIFFRWKRFTPYAETTTTGGGS